MLVPVDDERDRQHGSTDDLQVNRLSTRVSQWSQTQCGLSVKEVVPC